MDYQDITLRKAMPEDIETLISADGSAQHYTYNALTDIKGWVEEMKKCIVYVVQKGDHAVGMISVEMKSHHHAYISGLLVIPEYQGQGIGGHVMTRMMKELEDIPRVDLVTHPHNTRAIRLYLSLGFRIESWKDDYFGDGEPRLVLARVK